MHINAVQESWQLTNGIDTLQKAISLPENKVQAVDYQLATVDAKNVPHVRTVTHRDILYPAGAAHLPVFLFATDVRSDKVVQTRENDRMKFAWLLADTNEQYRVAGRVRAIPGPTHLFHGGALAYLPPALRTMDAQGYDWEKKLVEEYAAIDGRLRAKLCNPPGGEEEERIKCVPIVAGVEDGEEKRSWERGLSNMCLVLIEPEEVIHVVHSSWPHKKTKFNIRSESGEWQESRSVTVYRSDKL
ncbi:pyridoxamine 5'-phosphate oxidase-domain-containing protein [Amylocystis lapponica]|nr:pyridoxamine 5'-phosphate oxidase-domain-containing protein [Amylocystis lapponica]